MGPEADAAGGRRRHGRPQCRRGRVAHGARRDPRVPPGGRHPRSHVAVRVQARTLGRGQSVDYGHQDRQPQCVQRIGTAGGACGHGHDRRRRAGRRIAHDICQRRRQSNLFIDRNGAAPADERRFVGRDADEGVGPRRQRVRASPDAPRADQRRRRAAGPRGTGPRARPRRRPDDHAIRATLQSEPDLERAADTLVETAVTRDGKDNITVVLARYTSS